MLIVREGAIFTILAPAKRRDVLEVWREKHAPAGQATDLRTVTVTHLWLSRTCDCYLWLSYFCGVGWGGVGSRNNVHWDFTRDGSFHWLHSTCHWRHILFISLHFPTLFPSLLFSPLYSLNFLLLTFFTSLLSSHPCSFHFCTLFTSLLFTSTSLLFQKVCWLMVI